MARVVVLAACALTFAWAARNSDPAALTGARVTSQGDTTRVTLELNAKVKYRAERLTKPDRLFIDLMDTEAKVSRKALHTITVDDARVAQVRVARRSADVTRVVLDLKRPLEHQITQTSSPHRLIIELRVAGAPKAAAAKATETKVVESRPVVARRIEPKAPEPKPAEPVPPAPVETKGTDYRTPEAKASALQPSEPKTDAPKRVPTPEKEAPPRAAGPTSLGNRSLTRALGLKISRVVLDPGHGGHDHGTTGPDGYTEKELVLDVAQRLGALIEQRLGAEVFYTRKEDVFVPLEERTALANTNRADLFLSIHANSTTASGISGAEVYYLNFNTSREAMDVAARENASHGKTIFELRELIQKIALKDKLDESREFATKVQDSLSSAWTKMDSSSRNRGVKKAPFVVLIGASMPSVLAEIGFLSNRRDEKMLSQPEQRQRLAEALCDGIERYAAGLGQASASAPASGRRGTPR